MDKMKQYNQWLPQVTSIDEDTPYHNYLASDEDSALGSDRLNVDGITLFHLENGVLTFRFYNNGEPGHTDLVRAFGGHKMLLGVPALEFAHPIVINSLSGDRSTVRGVVSSEFFGASDTPLSGATIWLGRLPKKWSTTDNWVHYEMVSAVPIQLEENGSLVIPGEAAFGGSALSGLTLKTDGWIARLREIPDHHRTHANITHTCYLTSEYVPLSEAAAQDFVDKSLIPFFRFVFGQRIRFPTMIGYQEGMAAWVRALPLGETSGRTLQSNWFLRSRHAGIDLSPLFEQFYRLTPEFKEHWRKVIDQYASSEEILGTLGDSALAASVSFSALEGLTRSMLSGYPCGKQWLRDDLSLKRGKNIKDAIEFVAEQELGRHSGTFRRAADQISRIRNATFHTDLTGGEDPADAYYRWNASQALVEILLLYRMGLESIPNRTVPHTFNVMGRDMFEDVRKEQLTFE